MIVWLTAFLDNPRGVQEKATAFWQRLTASGISAPRGDDGRFATLLPPDGDPYLRVQALDDGEAHNHLDLHVTDRAAMTRAAVEAGATVAADHGDVTVLRSPGGLQFCLVDEPGGPRRPSPVVRPDGTTSLLDQVCIDVPAPRLDDELSWWSEFTGWRAGAGDLDEFRSLARPAGLPIRLLFQRLDDTSGPVRCHLDFASSARDAEVEWQLAQGAALVARRRGWTVLRDPAGREYCVTDRDPVSGA